MAFSVYIPFFEWKLHPHAHAFEVRSVRKICVHIIHPDSRLIPFDAYNLSCRDQWEQTQLAPLRASSMPSNLTTISNPVTDPWMARILFVPTAKQVIDGSRILRQCCRIIFLRKYRICAVSQCLLLGIQTYFFSYHQ
jgi:hypothetical protein